MPETLRSEAIDVARIGGALRDELFALFAAHYDRAERARFDEDLDQKDAAILLRRDDGTLAGFSTQSVFDVVHDSRQVRVLFSGDTIIDPRDWGTQELVRAWCRFAGNVKGAAPHLPLYWMLISKGHRTYLYLPFFFSRFFPSCNGDPDPFERTLMHRLGRLRFGDRYDPLTGLIDARAPLDRLRPEIDSAPQRTHNRHVAYFLERNPRYADGVELLCLTEIDPSNMRSFARREAERGMSEMLVSAAR